MEEFEIGTKVKERYILKEYKGSGSFGEVWLAHDEILDYDIAIKIYISLDPRGINEFKSEYKTTLEIYHPNLLTTQYFDVWEHRPYLIMKYCAKGSCADQAGKIDEYALWQFIHDVAAGLNYLHNMPEPVIHQDIKPDNILIDDNDRYLITDFGISKKIRATMRKQSKRDVGAGALAYMSPERFDSEPISVKASDIWSLGVSIFELATGALPFSGMGGGMQRHGAEMPTLNNRWSKELNMVMQSCLAIDTWNRPTAEQLEKYANAIITGQPAIVTWPTPPNFNDGEGNDIDDSGDEGEEPLEQEESSNKKRILLIAIRCAVIILIILFLSVVFYKKSIKIPTGQTPIAADEIIETKDSVAVVPKTKGDTSLVSQTETEEEKTITDDDAKEKIENAIESGKEKADNAANKLKNALKEEKTITDDNVTILQKALDDGDYQTIQKLANQGYAAAYGPLAKYYLKNNDYKTAEFYALKAKAAGDSEGEAVLNTLRSLGYYDDK